MDVVGSLILRALDGHADEVALSAIKGEVEALCEKFPLYSA